MTDSPKQIIATLHVSGLENPPPASSGEINSTLLGKSTQIRKLKPKTVELTDKMVLRVGRDHSNDLVLKLPNVSRFHALFAASTSGVVLSDLSSTNGTFVNGAPITTPIDIETGDMVEIGSAKIRVELNAEQFLPSETEMIATEANPITEAGMVTVLVADVKKYTRLSEALPPADVAAMLQSWFDAVSEIVRAFEGDVDKYMGDCVMALWRSTLEDTPSQANKAASAALSILQATRQLSESAAWKHREIFPWRCRVALNTGEVLIGPVGSRGARAFTVLGDVVNVAFRLDNIGSELEHEFLVSAATAQYLKDAFQLKKLGEFNVKGRSQSVEVYAPNRTQPSEKQ